MEEELKFQEKGMGWRVSLSILVGVAWLVFLIIWLFFYASDFGWYKTASVLLLSLLVIGGILGAPWMLYAKRHQSDMEKEMWKTKGFKARIWISGCLAIVLMAFLIYWFWYQASLYGVFQNIAILIVSVLIIGGILGAFWAPWGMKYGNKFDQKHPIKEAVYFHDEKHEEPKEKETPTNKPK